jgi:hypothetical protein
MFALPPWQYNKLQCVAAPQRIGNVRDMICCKLDATVLSAFPR